MLDSHAVVICLAVLGTDVIGWHLNTLTPISMKRLPKAAGIAGIGGTTDAQLATNQAAVFELSCSSVPSVK